MTGTSSRIDALATAGTQRNPPKHSRSSSSGRDHIPELMSDRREFIRRASAGALLASPLGTLACRAAANSTVSPSTGGGWDLVPGILRRIVPPTFPARDFEIGNYGARADGTTDCTDA